VDVPAALPDDDVLAEPIRARLFAALTDLRRPATAPELAALVRRHPNTVRVQLRLLEDAGLIECRSQRPPRGRPRHMWTVAPGARPGGRPPDAHANLGRWLARAMARGGAQLHEVEAAGRQIGAELAPDRPMARVTAAMQDALTALGFAPSAEAIPDGSRYVLANCPYRDAVAENPAVVCTLHRGITQGLLDRLDPPSRLTSFVARDPYQAGCSIEIATGAG